MTVDGASRASRAAVDGHSPAADRCRAALISGLLLAVACQPAAPPPTEDGPASPSTEAAAAAPDGFRIDPVRPVDELREEALAASPPVEDGDFREPDLVEITDLEPGIRLEIRYATDDNFMATPFYRQARAFLQRPAAEAVVRVHEGLRDRGYGLLVFDAYRPWHVTKMFWEATPEHQRDYVADPAAGSRHNRGAAVDLTLYDLETGEPVPMPSGYDEFTERASPDWQGGTEEQRRHRDLLRQVMEAEGFEVYEHEWWHFDHRDWRHYPILDLTFEELDERAARAPASADEAGEAG